MIRTLAARTLLASLACAVAGVSAAGNDVAPATDWPQPLPSARANVAVAAGGQPWQLFAHYGLGEPADASAIAADGYRWTAESGWQRVAPGEGVAQGRLAASAVWMAGSAWLIGGYTVADDGSEKSMPEVLRWQADVERWQQATVMPVPVDDSVALVYADRWLLLVSGWHDDGNVDLVQVYDSQADRWTQATPWPGPAVFGHAGGIVDEHLVICDGVAVVGMIDGKRQFALQSGCWHGLIGVNEAQLDIRWKRLPSAPCPAAYRAAATGTTVDGPRILFAGGGTRAYNYDGIGYDGQPVPASDCVQSFDLGSGQWRSHARLAEARMDLRGLIEHAGEFLLVGGMSGPRQPVADVLRYRP